MEAYANLKALNDNLPNRPSHIVESRYVEQFHSVLALLQQQSSVNLNRFKVPASAIVVKAGQDGRTIGLDTGFDWYDVHYVKMKIEALLSFFELQWAEPKPRMSFRPQESNPDATDLLHLPDTVDPRGPKGK